MKQRERPLVLVADDDRLMRMIARTALENEGFDVEECEDGQSALVKWRHCEPDLVLLDVIMPGLNGFEVCEAVRRDPAGEFLPIMMMTGLEDVESIARSYRSGATDFVTKPCNYFVLASRLRYMLRAAQNLGELRTSERRLRDAQRIARLGSWEWDTANQSLVASDEAYHLVGIEKGTPADVALERFRQRVHADDVARVVDVLTQATSSLRSFSVEFRLTPPGGAERVVHVEGRASTDQGLNLLVGTLQDITEKRSTDQTILKLAFYDVVTELPNRSFLERHLTYILAQARRQQRIMAVLSLDLDMFKRINDTLGHAAGDTVLRVTAARLRRVLRGTDCIARTMPEESTGDLRAADAVARFGGDEFVILLTDVVRHEDVPIVAQRVLDAVVAPVDVDGREVVLTASCGIACYPDDGDDVATLLKNSDAALYRAKAAGRNRFHVYTEAIGKVAQRRLALEHELRRALERGNELEVFYQPKVNLRDARVVGMEALVRWRNPERGMVPPLELIQVAEETGLIGAIGDWVLRTACEFNARLVAQGYGPLKVAVNVAAAQFMDRRFGDLVARALEDTRLPPKLLQLEITESTLLDDIDSNRAILERFKGMGISIALDDFGTGYSSLRYLTRFPIDTLKIDCSFVRDLPGSSVSSSVASAIIALSHSLGLIAVAEGVETEAQLAFMRERQCHEVQGYYFSRPVPGPAFIEWVSSRQVLEVQVA